MRLLLLVVSVLALYAEEPPSKVLVSVHLDAHECKLTWTVAEGRYSGEGKKDFWPSRFYEFSVDLDKAIISLNDDEFREYPEEKAAILHAIRDRLIKIAADATKRWDEGEGEKLDRPEPPKAKGKLSEQRRLTPFH